MLTVPNLVSLLRIALVPVFAWLVVGADNPVAAGWLLGLIGSTDWVDGFLARKLGQISKVGEFLDPLADRLAVAVAVIVGLVEGILPAWLAWAIIVREAVIGVGALLVGWKARTKLTVRRLGKLATLLLYAGIAWFYVSVHDFTTGLVIAYVLTVPGLVAYYAVGVQYVGDARSALRAARAPGRTEDSG